MTSRLFLTLVGTLALVGAACSDDDVDTSTTLAAADQSSPDDVSASGARRQPQGSSSYFSIEEIGVGPQGYVSLTNITDVPVTLAGLHLCQDNACVELPDVAVEPAATVRVAEDDGGGLNDVVVTEADLGTLSAPDGEIALYSSAETDGSEAMIVYVEWGSTPHDRTDDAIEAGLWLADSFAPTADYATRLYRESGSGLWLWDPNE